MVRYTLYVASCNPLKLYCVKFSEHSRYGSQYFQWGVFFLLEAGDIIIYIPVFIHFRSRSKFFNDYGTYSTLKEMLSTYQIREAYWTERRFTSLESLTFLTPNLAEAYKFHI